MKSISTLKRGAVVTLNTDSSTLTGNFKAGENFKFLGIHNGSFVRLSRVGDNAKLMVEPSRIGYEWAKCGADWTPYIAPARPDYAQFESPHSDASGPSREIVTSVCLAGEYSSTSTIHLTPSEEQSYNAGMAKLAELG